MSKKDTFCILPWIHNFINLGGEFQVCCTGEEFANFILDDQDRKILIQDRPQLNDVMNSHYLKQFRVDLLNGKFPKSCARCVQTENDGGVSRRIIENEQYAHLKDKVLAQTLDDGTLTSESVYHIDYRLGNICNLQCRMCHPRASSKWIKEYGELDSDLANPLFQSTLDTFKNMGWMKDDSIIEDFKQKVKNIERLHFGGGEPLYSPIMQDILKVAIESGVSQKIILSYNTNMTILSDEILELWSHFKEVRIMASIDGVGKLNDYIRYPSKWEQIDKNLKFLDINHSKYNISEILISTTVQMNNIFHIDKLMDYLAQFKFVKPVPNLVALYYPRFLSLTGLPRNLAKISFLKLMSLSQKAQEQLTEDDSYLVQNFKQIANSCLRDIDLEARKKRQEEFVRYSRNYDKEKKLDVFEVNPEFKTLFSQFPSKD